MCGQENVLTVGQVQRPDAAVHEELAAAQKIEKLHIAKQIGIPGLTIHQHRGDPCIQTHVAHRSSSAHMLTYVQQ